MATSEVFKPTNEDNGTKNYKIYKKLSHLFHKYFSHVCGILDVSEIGKKAGSHVTMVVSSLG